MKLQTRCNVRARKYRDWQRQIRSDKKFFGLMDEAHKNLKPCNYGPRGQPIYNWSETGKEMKRLYDIKIGRRVRC